MDKLFLSILNMSLIGAFVIAVICIARLPLKKAPKIISYCLWGVAGFRLVFPFSIESIFSLIPFKAQIIPADIAMQRVPRIDSGILFVNNAVSSILPAAEPVASVNPLQVWTAIGAWVWLAGVAGLVIYGVVSFLILKGKMNGAAHTETNIYEAENIKSPFVLGIFKPKIYLPLGLSAEEKSYILLHEKTHIKRHDHIIKFAAYFILCLHWFNPFVWAAFLLMGIDMEMSCDERVLKQMGTETKKDYSLSLLSLATERRIIGGSPLAFGEGGVKGRIKNILNFKKPSRMIIVAAVSLAAVLSIGFAVNRVSLNKDISENKILSTLGYTKGLVLSVLDNRTIFSENNENISRIIESLPVPDYREYKLFSLQAEPLKEINIVYQFNDNYTRGGNGIDPYYGAVEENNALLLLASVEGLQTVNFLSYENRELTELNRRDSYTINDLTQRFGNIKPLEMGFTDLYNALGANIYLSEFYFAHYARIYLGNEPGHVAYRNGEPEEIRERADGSIVWIYPDFGRIYNASPDGIVNPGYTAFYYFNNPQAERDNIFGLYATRFINAENYEKTYDEIIGLFGLPTTIKDMAGGDKYMAYLLISEYRNINAYFVLHNNRVIEEGIMYGDDYSGLEINDGKGMRYASAPSEEAKLPKLELYSGVPANLQAAKPIPKNEAGWYPLDYIVSAVVYCPWEADIMLYLAEAGTEVTPVSVPFPIEKNTDTHIIRIDIGDIFPEGFLGHAWAVATDSEGVEHYSETMNIIYPRPGYDINGNPLFSD